MVLISFREVIGSNIERVEPADVGFLFERKNIEQGLLVEKYNI